MKQKRRFYPPKIPSQFPWLSLILLWTTYSLFGWLTFNVTTLQKAIPLTITLTLLIAGILASPLKNTRHLITRWSKTDIGTFVTITLLALLGTILLTWFHIFTSTLILLCAEALARLELQTCGITGLKAFFLLLGFSGLGLGVGWIVSHYDANVMDYVWKMTVG